jgi:HlyD family secretion protein
MKRSLIISGLIVLFFIIALVAFNRISAEKKKASQYTEVFKGGFEIAITSAGELMAENSVEIKAPEIAQRGDMRPMDLRIQDLVPEGTEVETGDYVGQLDRSDFDNTLKDILEWIATQEKDLEMKLLDSAVTLSALRDEVQNQRYVAEADSVTLLNSKYESPNILRQAEINYDQAKRTLRQRERRYALSVEYAKFAINIQRIRIGRFTRRKNDYEEVLSNFTIKAPSPGMIIYKRDRRGNKRKTGSSISSFDRVVATLPDLSSMMSRIYISEIDISKLKAGLAASIVVDAFPNNNFTGLVTSVANIGEKLPNTDSKVFEVLIRINGTDPLLRPSMTTGNKIVIKTVENAIQVPIECVQAGEDSIPFVYTKNKMKKVVVLGESNEKYVIIEQGLEPGTTIFLNEPEEHDKFRLTGKELIPVIRERERARRAVNEKFIIKEAELKEGDRPVSDTSEIQKKP